MTECQTMNVERLRSGSTDFETIVFERRSVRGYTNQTVPREVLEEIIRIAQRAPSSMNTQPWHFHVLTGEEFVANHVQSRCAVNEAVASFVGFDEVHAR